MRQLIEEVPPEHHSETLLMRTTLKELKVSQYIRVARVLKLPSRLVTWPFWPGLRWTEVLTWANKCTLLLNDYETRRHGRIRPSHPTIIWISDIFALFSLDFTHVYHETLSGQNSPKTPKKPPDIVYIAFDKKSPQKNAVKFPYHRHNTYEHNSNTKSCSWQEARLIPSFYT